MHADAVDHLDGSRSADGAVVVDARGVVIDVGPAIDILPRHSGLGVERVRGALLPGLVNAHTHVELSALRGQVPGGAGFVPWVEHMLSIRAEHEPESDSVAIERAVDELVAFGTTAVGEVTNTLAAVNALARRGVVGCVFHEVFGVLRRQAEERVARLPQVVEEEVGPWPTPELRYAPTPHTLYTTHPEVVRKLLRDAGDRGLRVSVHMAEHAAERRFLERGDGPSATGAGRAPRNPRRGHRAPRRIADRLRRHARRARSPRRLRPPDRRAPRRAGASSPSARLSGRLPPSLQPLHRVARLAAAPGRPRRRLFPALGTDSLASNASLDVLVGGSRAGRPLPHRAGP